jgi:hypothetical protein
MKLSSNSPLQKVQRAAISIEAKKAYEIHLRAGLIDPSITADEFRHTECWKAAQVTGASQARQAHYATIMGHFLQLQGRSAEAFRYHVRSGQKTEVDATQTAWHLTRAVASLGKAVSASGRLRPGESSETGGQRYLVEILRDKFRRPNLTWNGLLDSDSDTMTRAVFEANSQAKKLRSKARP